MAETRRPLVGLELVMKSNSEFSSLDKLRLADEIKKLIAALERVVDKLQKESKKI